jgi:hypothetical protein
MQLLPSHSLLCSLRQASSPGSGCGWCSAADTLCSISRTRPTEHRASRRSAPTSLPQAVRTKCTPCVLRSCSINPSACSCISPMLAHKQNASVTLAGIERAVVNAAAIGGSRSKLSPARHPASETEHTAVQQGREPLRWTRAPSGGGRRRRWTRRGPRRSGRPASRSTSRPRRRARAAATPSCLSGLRGARCRAGAARLGVFPCGSLLPCVLRSMDPAVGCSAGLVTPTVRHRSCRTAQDHAKPHLEACSARPHKQQPLVGSNRQLHKAAHNLWRLSTARPVSPHSNPQRRPAPRAPRTAAAPTQTRCRTWPAPRRPGFPG